MRQFSDWRNPVQRVGHLYCMWPIQVQSPASDNDPHGLPGVIPAYRQKDIRSTAGYAHKIK